MLKVSHLTGWAVAAGLVLTMGVGIAGASTISVINLDFGPTAVGTDPANTTVSPYHAVTGDTGNTTWNSSLGTGDVAGGLFFGDGSAATGVSYNLGQTNASSSSVLGTQPTSTSALGTAAGTNTLYASPHVIRDGIFYSATGSWIGESLQISGLAAGTYNIYYAGENTNLAPTSSPTTDTIYAGQSSAAGDFTFSSYTSDTISHTALLTTFVHNANYAQVQVTLTAGNYLNLAFVGDINNKVDRRGFLNSLQLERVGTAVPEPASLGLLGMGAGLMLLRKRRRSC